jgi:hypothetical protein
MRGTNLVLRAQMSNLIIFGASVILGYLGASVLFPTQQQGWARGGGNHGGCLKA